MIKCPHCGAHVPAEVAVEIPIGDRPERFCSARCAERAEVESTRRAPVTSPLAAPKRFLVAVDGSGPSLRATELAVSLARLSGGSITLLHAIEPRWLGWLSGEGALAEAEGFGLRAEDATKALHREAEAQLDRCRRVCEAAGVPVAWRIEVAAPVRAILNASPEADLIVLGSRGLGAISGVALGSLSHRVLGETRKPVLIVH